MEELILMLKQHDQKRQTTTRYMLLVIVMFTLIFISGMATATGVIRIGYGLLILGFALSAFYFGLQYRRLLRTDYTAPPATILREAEKRCRFASPGFWVLYTLILILFNIGGGFILFGILTKYNTPTTLPVYLLQVILTTALWIGISTTRRRWEKEYAPVKEMIQKLKENQ